MSIIPFMTVNKKKDEREVKVVQANDNRQIVIGKANPNSLGPEPMQIQGPSPLKEPDMTKFLQPAVKTRGFQVANDPTQFKPNTVIQIDPNNALIDSTEDGGFWAPKADEVRIRDVVRETPKAAWEVTKGIFRGITRSGASVGLSIMRPFSQDDRDELSIDPSAPEWEQNVHRFLFGDEPVHDLARRIAESELAIKDFSANNPNWAVPDKLALPVAFTAVIGSTAMDFTPGGTAEKNIVRSLQVAKTEAQVTKILTKAGVADDIIKMSASRFAKETDEQVIKKGFQNIVDLQNTTVKVGQWAERQSVKRMPLASDDAQIMVDFIDNVRLKRPQNFDLELDASRIAEHYGIAVKGKATPAKLANAFEEALTNKGYEIYDVNAFQKLEVRDVVDDVAKSVDNKVDDLTKAVDDKVDNAVKTIDDKVDDAAKITEEMKKKIPVKTEMFGAVTGFEQDEEGHLKFDPIKGALGFAGVTAMSKGKKIVPQMFRGDKLMVAADQLVDIEKRLQTLGLTERKVRSFKEMQDAAEELGTDVWSLLKETKQNRITDKEVVALRELINNNSQFIAKRTAEMAKNPAKTELFEMEIGRASQQIDQALTKLVKGGTEAGRAVAAFRIQARNTMDPSFWMTQAKKVLGGTPLNTQQQQAIMDLTNAMDRNGLVNFIASLRTPSLAEKAVTFWKAGLLTSPTTHIANVTGNAAMKVLQTATDVVGTGLDVMAALITGKRSVTFVKPTNTLKYLGQGVQKAGRYMKTGVYDVELMAKYDMPRTVNFENKILNGYTSGVFRALGAEDIVFRQAAMAESLEKQAWILVKNEGLKGAPAKEAVKNMLMNPTNEMVMNAIDAAEYATFQSKNLLASAVSSAKAAVRDKGPGGQALYTTLEFLMPFVKTPTNVAARAIDYSPAGFIKALVQAANPATRSQKTLIENLSRAVTGTTVIGFGTYLASKGLITGNAPENEAERADFYASGKQPNSIKIGDKWFSINRISPIGNLLATGANFFQLDQDQNGASLGLSTIGSFGKQLTQQTFLKGVSGALEVLNDPERNAEKFIQQSVTSIVPSIVNRLATTIDPTMRKPEGIMEAFKDKIPGLGDDVAVRRDVFGNKVESPSGRLSLIDPFNTSEAKEDPLLAEVNRLGVFIGLPAQTVNNVKLTNAEYAMFQKVNGRILRTSLEELMSSPDFKGLTSAEKVDEVEGLIRDVRSATRDAVFAPLMIRRYELPDTTDPEVLTEVLNQVGTLNEFKTLNREGQKKVITEFMKQVQSQLPSGPIDVPSDEGDEDEEEE